MATAASTVDPLARESQLKLKINSRRPDAWWHLGPESTVVRLGPKIREDLNRCAPTLGPARNLGDFLAINPLAVGPGQIVTMGKRSEMAALIGQKLSLQLITVDLPRVQFGGNASS